MMRNILVALLVCACAYTAKCVWVKEMENEGFYQGDIALDPDEHMPGWGSNRTSSSSTYASIKGGRWPQGKIPYVITSSIAPQGVRAINNAIANYHKYTCLRFYKRTNEREYISFYRGGGCMSPVGWRRGRRNDISLASGCWYTGIVMHEIGHSMGFWHEQMRPDRDQHVRILWGNIQRGMASQFQKCDARIIDSLGTLYDYSSMMHYGAYAFSGNRRPVIQTIDPSKQKLIGQRNGFSEIDKKQLGLMYDKICTGGGGGGGKGECEDLDDNCRHWAERGECHRNPNWMKENCCKSCKDAEAGGVCNDDNENCRGWAENDECAKNPKWMRFHCCKSCLDK